MGEGQYSLHHEFSETVATKSLEKRSKLMEKFEVILVNNTIQNLATGQQDVELFEEKLRCLDVGKKLYEEFKTERFVFCT